jgi:hypothetical protein
MKDDKVYVALTGGTIQTYQTEGLQDGMFGHYRRGYVKLILFGVDGPVGTSQPRARLISTRKGLARKPIDQLEYLEDLDALAILSGELSLHAYPHIRPLRRIVLVRSNGYLIRSSQSEDSDDLVSSEIRSIHRRTDDLGPTQAPRANGQEAFDCKKQQGGEQVGC